MPISCQIDEQKDLLRARAAGDVTWEEVHPQLQQLEVVLMRRAPLDVLLDLTDCTSLPDRSQLENLAADIHRLGGRTRFHRCTIVATQPALFGMARMFEILAEDQFAATRVFRTVAEGEAWLMQRES